MSIPDRKWMHLSFQDNVYMAHVLTRHENVIGFMCVASRGYPQFGAGVVDL